MEPLKFDWTVEEINAQIQKIITVNKAFIDKVETIPLEACTFENVCQYLASNDGEAGLIAGPIKFLQHVSADPAIREASRNFEKSMNEFDIYVYQRSGLYERYSRVMADLARELSELSEKKSNNSGVRGATPPQYQYVKTMIYKFEVNGAQLDELGKNKIKDLINQKDELERKFSENIAETDAFLYFNESELAGCPADFLDRTRVDAKGQPVARIEGNPSIRHKITYKYPDLIAIKTRCSNGNTRKKVQTMAYTRCPKNLKILADLLRVRHQIAKLLGYKSHADLQLKSQIIKNGDNARKLLESILEKLAPQVKQYTALLSGIKMSDPNKTNNEPLEWHDYDYYHEKNLSDNYSVDNNELRNYFPSEYVLDKMFEFYADMFGLRFEKYTERMWHADVLSYKVFSMNQDSSRTLIGAFHLDLYPREGKYNHYAMWDLVSGFQTMNNMVEASRQILPIATMVCNFTAPVIEGDKIIRPSLLEHSEVETLFHEFGHVIHGIVGGYQNRYHGQGGANTEVDFVEAPSQMMENWVYEPELLKKISKHYQTGETLSDEFIKKINDSRTIGVGREWARIMGMALADQVIHTSSVPEPIRFTTLAIKKQMCNVMRTSLLMQPPENYGDMLAEWGHIGDDMYSARYYSYTLTRLLASDMYSIFLSEKDTFSASASADTKNRKSNTHDTQGMRYRKLILERGGTVDGLTMIKDFMGRNPSMFAFLNYTCGIPKSQLSGDMELEFKDDSFYEDNF